MATSSVYRARTPRSSASEKKCFVTRYREASGRSCSPARYNLALRLGGSLDPVKRFRQFCVSKVCIRVDDQSKQTFELGRWRNRVRSGASHQEHRANML